MYGRGCYLVIAALAAIAACHAPRATGPSTGSGAAPAAPQHAFATTISSTGVGPLGAKTPRPPLGLLRGCSTAWACRATFLG